MSSCIVRFVRRDQPTVRLLCVPYAGSGAAAFRLWPKALPTRIDVAIAQLPGRESRFAQTPLASIPLIVEELVTALDREPDQPTAIFGHSMGAVIAFELAHALERAGRAPLHLFVSGSRAPGVRDDDLPMLHPMPDDELVAEIDRRYGGIPAAVLEQRDLMALLLPALRADITALECYERPTRGLLSCPVTAMAGTRDARALPADVEHWRRETNAGFVCRVFEGDHFFINPHRDAVLTEISSTLDAIMQRGAA